MRRLLASPGAAVMAFLAGTVAAGGTATAGTSRPALRDHLSSTALSLNLARVLARQTHIEVQGRIFGPGKLHTDYDLRYERGGRESLTQSGGELDRLRLHGRFIHSMTSIYIGNRAYTSYDGRHWLDGVRVVPPGPLDALSLNAADAPCCVAASGRSSVQLSTYVRATWRGLRVYRFDYRCVAYGYAATGSALVDASSFLPLFYTQRSQNPALQGMFELKYGGRFAISRPVDSP